MSWKWRLQNTSTRTHWRIRTAKRIYKRLKILSTTSSRVSLQTTYYTEVILYAGESASHVNERRQNGGFCRPTAHKHSERTSLNSPQWRKEVKEILQTFPLTSVVNINFNWLKQSYRKCKYAALKQWNLLLVWVAITDWLHGDRTRRFITALTRARQ
jgi:hypothetical protein